MAKLTPEAVAEVTAAIECPECHIVGSLALEWKLVAKPQGTYSLAGVQPKVSAKEWPYLVCQTESCCYDLPFTKG